MWPGGYRRSPRAPRKIARAPACLHDDGHQPRLLSLVRLADTSGMDEPANHPKSQQPAVMPQRCWYQFSLRTLMVGTGTLAIALAAGLWWNIHLHRQTAVDELAEQADDGGLGDLSLRESGAFATWIDAGADQPVKMAAPVRSDVDVIRALNLPDAAFIKAWHNQSETKLLANLGVVTDKNGLITNEFRKKILAFHHVYKAQGKRRHVFVYDSWVHSFPGFQPETIIICDASYAVLDWKEVGGGPMLEHVAFEETGANEQILRLTRNHRHTVPNPQRGIYGFSLAEDKITALPNVEWLYRDDAEKSRYDEMRNELRMRRAARAAATP